MSGTKKKKDKKTHKNIFSMLPPELTSYIFLFISYKKLNVEKFKQDYEDVRNFVEIYMSFGQTCSQNYKFIRTNKILPKLVLSKMRPLKYSVSLKLKNNDIVNKEMILTKNGSHILAQLHFITKGSYMCSMCSHKVYDGGLPNYYTISNSNNGIGAFCSECYDFDSIYGSKLIKLLKLTEKNLLEQLVDDKLINIKIADILVRSYYSESLDERSQKFYKMPFHEAVKKITFNKI